MSPNWPYTVRMRRLATFNCADCGVPVTKNIESGRPRVCITCAGLRVVAHSIREARAARQRRWERLTAAEPRRSRQSAA